MFTDSVVCRWQHPLLDPGPNLRNREPAFTSLPGAPVHLRIWTLRANCLSGGWKSSRTSHELWTSYRSFLYLRRLICEVEMRGVLAVLRTE